VIMLTTGQNKCSLVLQTEFWGRADQAGDDPQTCL
jgi:hypothetical protein